MSFLAAVSTTGTFRSRFSAAAPEEPARVSRRPAQRRCKPRQPQRASTLEMRPTRSSQTCRCVRLFELEPPPLKRAAQVSPLPLIDIPTPPSEPSAAAALALTHGVRPLARRGWEERSFAFAGHGGAAGGMRIALRSNSPLRPTGCLASDRGTRPRAASAAGDNLQTLQGRVRLTKLLALHEPRFTSPSRPPAALRAGTQDFQGARGYDPS